MQTNSKTDSQIIDALGGTGEVSRLFTPPLSDAAVSAWRKKRIPPACRQVLTMLRPEVFGPSPDGDADNGKANRELVSITRKLDRIGRALEATREAIELSPVFALKSAEDGAEESGA